VAETIFHPLTTFSELGVHETIINALSALNITQPTPIQQKAIKALLKSEIDMLAVSNTGTGKTAAFGIPLLHQIKPSQKTLQALVLCPTRELAQQTATQIRSFAKQIEGFHVKAIFGGADLDKQIEDLEKVPAQVIVATPGRFIDILNQEIIHLDDLSHFILDEADEMLRMGFKEDIDYIRSHIDHSFLTWMFCATMGEQIKKVVDQYLDPNYKLIEADPDTPLNPDIEHQYMVCKLDQKREGLKYFLRLHEEKNGIVFCRTKAAVDEISDYLIRNGFSAAAIHSDLTQKERDSVMRKMKNNEIRILVASDIAARGLDIKGLGFVVHFHLPEQREYFNHRSGRTGRAGNKGISLIIVFQKEVKKINAIANNLGLKFTKVEFTFNPEEAETAAPTKGTVEPSNPDMVTFYINMGKANDVNRKNLVDFICAEAGLVASDFGTITIEKKRSYFEVHQKAIRKLVAGLKGLVVDGKQLVLTRKDFDDPSNEV
jgi:ATP-dependent RNA helicase DeaD